MILVDSSVWIDFFNGADTPEVDFLSGCLGLRPVTIGDLMLAEVLQGFRKDKDFRTALELFDSVPVVDLAGREIAIRAARNFRKLRATGFTVRKTIDCVIATYCIVHKLPLLQNDRDFEPFHEHLGLQRAPPSI